MTWEFGDNAPETVNKWTEATIRDADKLLTFAPFMTAQTDGAIRNPDASKLGGIFRVHTDFQGVNKKGKKVTISNVADIDANELGIYGDAIGRDQGANLDTYTMELKYDSVMLPVRSNGELNEKRVVMDFRKEARAKLSKWAAHKTDGALWLQLNGLTSYTNGTKLKYWPQNGQIQDVYGNAIQAFDADHIAYAGDATSVSTVDIGDVLTAQFLTKLETTALEDLAIPLDPLMVDGMPELILFVGNRGKEQLLYDDDWIKANKAGAQTSDNPIVKRSIGKFGNIRVVPVPFALNLATNVAQAVLCGKDAIQIAKVEDFSWFEDFEDIRKRRKVISIGGQFGVAPTFLNGTRRNALAVRHYSRT